MEGAEGGTPPPSIFLVYLMEAKFMTDSQRCPKKLHADQVYYRHRMGIGYVRGGGWKNGSLAIVSTEKRTICVSSKDFRKLKELK